MYVFKRYGNNNGDTGRLCLLKVKGTMNNLLKLFAVNPVQSNEGVISTIKKCRFFQREFTYQNSEKPLC